MKMLWQRDNKAVAGVVVISLEKVVERKPLMVCYNKLKKNRREILKKWELTTDHRSLITDFQSEVDVRRNQ